MRQLTNEQNNIELIQALEKQIYHKNTYIYHQLNNIANYYKGEFTEVNENLDFMRVANDFFELAFYKTAYITYKDNRFIVLEHIEKNKYKQYKENKFYEINPNLIVSFNYGLGNLWIQWYTLFKQEAELFKIWKLNAIADARKILLQVNTDNDEVIEQLKQNFYDLDEPFLKSYSLLANGESGFENNFKPLTNGNSNTAISFDNITQHFKLFADRLGYSTAQESKKERLTTGENMINTHNTNNLMEIPRRNLKVFAYDVMEKFNIELNFERVEELLQTNEGEIEQVEDKELEDE
ncbi:hypothetical protein [Mycoplasmopsis bovis]|uniref:hypothetical protein n=1 Tax=Mycoplasmopsis bovis TaxID=28903 RepID=UPI00094AEB62|nr:hypothetical protein [Mycoplasmopsis bovis]